MATRGQITEQAMLVHDDEYRKEFPVESYVDETYWADLPLLQRTKWMWAQQVRHTTAYVPCVCMCRRQIHARLCEVRQTVVAVLCS